MVSEFLFVHFALKLFQLPRNSIKFLSFLVWCEVFKGVCLRSCITISVHISFSLLSCASPRVCHAARHQHILFHILFFSLPLEHHLLFLCLLPLLQFEQQLFVIWIVSVRRSGRLRFVRRFVSPTLYSLHVFIKIFSYFCEIVCLYLPHHVIDIVCIYVLKQFCLLSFLILSPQSIPFVVPASENKNVPHFFYVFLQKEKNIFFIFRVDFVEHEGGAQTPFSHEELGRSVLHRRKHHLRPLRPRRSDPPSVFGRGCPLITSCDQKHHATTPHNDAHDRRCPRHNDFQDDLPSLRAYVAKHLIGQWVVMDKDDAFVAPPNGAAWGGPQRVRGQITRVLYDGCFLCTVQFGDEEPTPVTAASFMLLSTEWCWEQKCARDDDRPIKPASKHARSVERARFLMQQLIAAHGGRNMEEVVAAGFDGNGENRRGFEQALDEAGVPLHERPLVINFDFDAVVAFHQALRFGRKHSRYSRADWRRRNKKGWVEGIERLIMEESGALFTKEEKRNVGLLYLDYCGGPDDSIDYEAVYANLPNLKVLGVTAARRQPRISCGERLRAAAPAHMQEIHTFEHTRVV